MNRQDGSPTQFRVVSEGIRREQLHAIGEILRRDTESVLEIDDLAGYVLVAWGRDGRPAVYPCLLGRENPVPAYVLPAYLQMAVHWWIEDGMPEGYKAS